MTKTATLNVRVDTEVKLDAEKVLKELGMPMSTLITLLLKQVSLTRKIPFEISLPLAPESVDVSKLSPAQFKELLVEAYQSADRGETVPMDDFFESFRGKINEGVSNNIHYPSNK